MGALTLAAPPAPAMVAVLGEAAELRFIDFFGATIRNPNTHAAYGVASHGFFRWLDQRGVRELAAIRTLFNWLITGQVVGQNPAAAGRGTKDVVKQSKTPERDGNEAKKLLASIDTRTVVRLHDRALIALRVYSLARISAARAMNVEDYYAEGKRWQFRLHEKGGKQHETPCHYLLEAWVGASGCLREG